MKKSITKTLGVAVLTGLFGFGSGVATAAETSAGVKEHMGLTVKTAREALEHATAGHKDLCVTSIKATVQHYKEITGDAAGKPMQDAMKLVKSARESCEKSETSKAAESLEQAIGMMEKVQATIK